MKKALPILLVLLTVAVVGGWWFKTQFKRNETQGLQLYGNVDIREVNLGFRVSGRVLEVNRDEGDEVKAGEVLARLDDEPYRREVEEARAQVAALRARLELMETGNRPQEIAQ